MIKIDQHFHTTLSDGVNSSKELLEDIKKEEYLVLIATEHDIINRDFSEWMKKFWFPKVEGVEISVTDKYHEIKEHTGTNSFHMTYYKDIISTEIEEILKNTCRGKQEKLNVQIDKLQNYGFDISQSDFYNYRESKFPGKDRSWYNVLFLAQYIFLSPENKNLVKNIFWREVSVTEFLKECLLSSGKYANIGTQQVAEYEPNLEQLANAIDGGVWAIAHPNSTFKSIDHFLQATKKLIQKYPITAIEINARADKYRIDTIMKFCKENNLLITFWSDFHKGRSDETHGSFGKTNPYISEKTLKENYKKFLKDI